jgi:Holliday junction resolvase-like predicted endonuclease
LGFLKERNLLDRKARFDVVSVLYLKDAPQIDLIKNAFGLSGDFIY